MKTGRQLLYDGQVTGPARPSVSIVTPVLDGVRFWGSPWTPEFYNWSFMLPRGDALASK